MIRVFTACNVDHQRKTVSDLERDNQDATIATALL
jgi:hypothetical protein